MSFSPTMDLHLYDPFRDMRFGPQNCFLCGTAVAAEQKLPVFPEWVQTKFDLKDKKLVLLDQSTPTYTGLTLPCCPACEASISELEKVVEPAAAAGVEALKNISPKHLYLWLGRIFYGIMVTELLAERSPLIKPEYPVGENPKMLQKLQSFFMLLQAIRVPMEFDDFVPGSVFIIPLEEEQEQPAFSYRDDLTTMMFSIKLGNTLLVAHLLDNGILKKALTPVWKEAGGKKLFAIQAAELSARIYYAAYLFNLVPDYFVRPVKPTDTQLVLDTLVDDITASIFNPWENETYATALEKFWQPWHISKPQILQNPELPLSFLLKEDGTFRQLESWEVPE